MNLDGGETSQKSRYSDIQFNIPILARGGGGGGVSRSVAPLIFGGWARAFVFAGSVRYRPVQGNPSACARARSRAPHPSSVSG